MASSEKPIPAGGHLEGGGHESSFTPHLTAPPRARNAARPDARRRAHPPRVAAANVAAGGESARSRPPNVAARARAGVPARVVARTRSL